ncbi:MAG: peptidoglycan editing factor PgeF [Alphaproteobacteria bacterium]
MMLTAANLDAPGRLRHGFFTRDRGVSQGVNAFLNCGFSSGDDERLVLANRSIAMEKLGVPAGWLTTVKQVHGTAVHRVQAPAPGPSAIEADALVTDRPGIVLGVLTADCAPVLLADRDAGVIGAAHAGWRGALAGITDSLVQAMLDLGAARRRIVAAVGPCIAKLSYEVGPDMHAAFADADPGGLDLFTPVAGSDRSLFDLKAYVRRRLERLGLENVEALPEDTFADEQRFFSARRSRRRGEDKFGLLLSAIGLMETV